MEIPTKRMTQSDIRTWLETAHAQFVPSRPVKTIEEARRLPKGSTFALVPGTAPNGTPCNIPVRIAAAQAFDDDDIIEFLDSDGTPMRVISTLLGLRKMPL